MESIIESENKKYYNQEEFSECLENIKTNPLKTKLKLEKYLKKYPDDLSGYTYYTSVLITLGKFDKAKQIIEIVEEKYSEFENKNEDFERNYIKNGIIFNKMRLLAYEENFEDLYKLCSSSITDPVGFFSKQEIILTLCRKKLNLIEEPINTNSYIIKQIVNYNENLFRSNMKKHIRKDKKSHNISLFNLDFPLDEIIEETKNFLLPANRFYTGFYNNDYYFKYDNCGTLRDGSKTDYFKVICFHNTSDYITIYPERYKEVSYTDLNYLNKKTTSKNKVKRLSQIDKFNRRYGTK